MSKEKILIVDDEEDICELLETILDTGDYELASAHSGNSALSIIATFKPALVLLDYMLPDMDGLEVLKKTKNLSPDTEVMMVTGRGSEQIAVQLMKAGAVEYIIKPFDYNEIRSKVADNLKLRTTKIKEKERALEKLQKENLLHKELQKEYQFDFVGVSEVMRKLFEQVKVIAKRNVTVLIRGESGTGKELIARIIHSESNRFDKPFLTVNCAALTETLIESELFGHEKGAFTGADSRRMGKFELAHGGTLFLDEIGDMSLKTQAKVLRVIQEHQFERVGGENSIKADIRIITATHRNLEEMCQEEKFREDLFYRINVHPIKIPPLHQRVDDIPVLFDYYVKKYSQEFSKFLEKTDEALYHKIVGYKWPGNVRELKNVVERMVMLTQSTILTCEDLPEEIQRQTVESPASLLEGPIPSLKDAVDQCKKELLVRALKHCKGNRTKSAELLGVTLRHVQNMMSKFGLN